MQAIKIVMPSEGDMTLLRQEGGSLLLQPVYYGGACAGPHIQIVEVDVKDGVVTDKVTVVDRFRMIIKDDGKVDIKRGTVAE